MTGGDSLSAGSSVLDACDALLAEPGRRQHRFAWLPDPDSPTGEWLVLDGYYPRNRVVLCCGLPGPALALCRELVPRHGLHLVAIDPDELGGGSVEDLLRERLDGAVWSRERHPPVASAPPVPVRAPTPSPATETITLARAREQRVGIGLGLAMIALALLETYLGVVVLAADHGQWLLGAGIVLDACCRVLATATAEHERDHQAVLRALALGSLEVVLREPGTRLDVPAVLARVSLGAIALGLVAAALGV